MGLFSLAAPILGAAAGFGLNKLSGGGSSGGGGSFNIDPMAQYKQQQQAYKDNLPMYLEQAQEYDPKFLQHQLSMQQQFGRPLQRASEPEGVAALEQLGAALQKRGSLSSLETSPEILDAFRQDIRGGQFARGTALSPISGISEARELLQTRIAERDKWLNLASALSGRVPAGQQVRSAGFGDIQFPQVSNLSSLQQQANQIAFGGWQQQQALSQQRQGMLGDVLGTAIQTVGPMVGGMFGGGGFGENTGGINMSGGSYSGGYTPSYGGQSYIF